MLNSARDSPAVNITFHFSLFILPTSLAYIAGVYFSNVINKIWNFLEICWSAHSDAEKLLHRQLSTALALSN